MTQREPLIRRPARGIPSVGETWKRREGKERVRVGRVWDEGRIEPATLHVPGTRDLTPFEAEGPRQGLIRLHPRHGGKWWWTTLPEFLKRFDFDEAAPDD